MPNTDISSASFGRLCQRILYTSFRFFPRSPNFRVWAFLFSRILDSALTKLLYLRISLSYHFRGQRSNRENRENKVTANKTGYPVLTRLAIWDLKQIIEWKGMTYNYRVIIRQLEKYIENKVITLWRTKQSRWLTFRKKLYQYQRQIKDKEQIDLADLAGKV